MLQRFVLHCDRYGTAIIDAECIPLANFVKLTFKLEGQIQNI